MLLLARQRFEGNDADRVQFLQRDLLAWTPGVARYDLIVTHFFLDCFPETELTEIVARLSQAATADAEWLLADFRIPEKGFARLHARVWVAVMYLFFRLAARIEASELVDSILREQSKGTKSIDDFARAFFGINDGDWGEVTYTFDDVVATLNQVQPYDWRTYLQRRVFDVAAQAPLEGITQGGYRLAFTGEPSKWTKNGEKEGKYSDFTYSAGFNVGTDGKIASVLWGSPAFDTGLAIGTEVVAVNGRKFDSDALKQAIRNAAGNGPAPELLVHSGDVYRTVKIAWHGGLRYPHLEKVGTATGTLDALLAPR